MKIRGKRRHALAAKRSTLLGIYTVMAGETTSTELSMATSLVLVQPGTPGSFTLAQSRTVDGFGRPVGRAIVGVDLASTPPRRVAQKSTVNFKMAEGSYDALREAFGLV